MSTHSQFILQLRNVLFIFISAGKPELSMAPRQTSQQNGVIGRWSLASSPR